MKYKYAMIYQYLPPSPHLQFWIREYLVFHFELDKEAQVPAKPYPATPEEGMTFYVKGSLLASKPEEGISERRPRAVIFGQPLQRQNLYISQEYLMVNIRFQPGMLFKLLRIPMTHFTDRNVDAEAVLGKEIREVNEQLVNAANYDDLLAIIESYLWKKVQQANIHLHPLDKIPQIILKNPQLFSLETYAHEACLSPSQFERRFVQQTGVSPKRFARVCRFTQAVRQKEQFPYLSWLSIAWDGGYNDYQHLVRDFKQFAGSLPNTLIQENKLAPERWLGLE